MALRFPPWSPRALNLFYKDNLIASETSISFLADDQAAKEVLIATYIEETFGLSATPTLDQSVVLPGFEFYQIETDYYIFIRN